MTEWPADVPDVHGASGQPGNHVHGAGGCVRNRSFRMQPLETDTPLFPGHSRTAGAQPWGQPEPEGVKKLRAPAAKRAPVLILHLDAEVDTDICLPLPLHKMKTERPEDHRSRIPTPG